MDRVAAFMARRAPGSGSWSTKRKEADTPEILSGVVDGVLCGAPVSAVIHNSDQHSKDYEGLRRTPRPSHADYTAWVKYGESYDIRGGGQFSGRLTAPLCFAGALALQVLEQRGITVAGHIAAIAGVQDEVPDFARVDRESLLALTGKPFPVFSDSAGADMVQAIEIARMEADSVGGVIRCFALGLPAGVGEPMFEGVENRLAAALFGIPAVRGVSFGDGFAAAAMRGSQHNDPFVTDGDTVRTRTNHAGGVLGGYHHRDAPGGERGHQAHRLHCPRAGHGGPQNHDQHHPYHSWPPRSLYCATGAACGGGGDGAHFTGYADWRNKVWI